MAITRCWEARKNATIGPELPPLLFVGNGASSSSVYQSGKSSYLLTIPTLDHLDFLWIGLSKAPDRAVLQRTALFLKPLSAKASKLHVLEIL